MGRYGHTSLTGYMGINSQGRGINPDVLDLNDGTMIRGLSPIPGIGMGTTADSFKLIKAGDLIDKAKNKKTGKWEVVGSYPVWKYSGRWQPSVIYRSRKMELDDDGGYDAYHPPTPQYRHGNGPGMGKDNLDNASATTATAYNPADPDADINGHPWDHVLNTPWCGIVVNPHTKRPYLQRAMDPHEGFYVSKSALGDPSREERDQRRYVDAKAIPFLVAYEEIRNHGVKQGDYAVVIVNQRPTPKVVGAIVADAKRYGHGEGSRALHTAILGKDPGRSGISNQDLIFVFFPSSRLESDTGGAWSSSWGREDVERRAQTAFFNWGGVKLVKELFPLA